MAMAYIQLYKSYNEVISEMPDEDAGRLIKALLAYSEGEDVGDDLGQVRFVFRMMAAQIDRDKKSYADKCERMRKNAEKRWKKESDADACEICQGEEEGKEEGEREGKEEREGKREGEREEEGERKEEEEGKGEEITPLYSPLGKHTQGEGVADTFDEPLRSAVIQWLEYKREKRQSYKPQGLSVLIDKIHKAARKHGDRAVAEIIHESMACNYQGIMWDRIGRRQQQTGNPFLEMLREEEGYGQI